MVDRGYWLEDISLVGTTWQENNIQFPEQLTSSFL